MITKVMYKSFIVNLCLAIIKLITGFLANSKTLLADAIHGVSDMLTDIIGLVGSKLASKKPDKTHPFGHGKIEYVASMFISIFIIVLGLTIFKNSFSNKEASIPYFVFILMPIIVLFKSILSNYLIKKGKALNSSILISSGMESKYDVLNTIFAFIFVILSYFQKYSPVFKYADMIGSIVISLITIKIGLSLFMINAKSVIGEIDLDPDKINNIKEIILNDKRIKNVKKITLLKYGQYSSLTVDIIVKSNYKLNILYNIEKNINKRIKNIYSNIRYITVNIRLNK